MSAQDLAATSTTFDFPEARPVALALESAQASKITSISLYSGRAEITRNFKLAVAEGQNQISIRGLPDRLQKDSVRVEGRGHASIHDVAILKAPQPSQESPESSVDAILRERKRRELKNQIASVKQTRSALNAYLGTLRANEVDVSKLGDIFTSHNVLAQKLDNDILDLETELVEMTQNMVLTPNWEDVPSQTPRVLSWQLTINVWAEVDEIVEILVKYVVSNADWYASYDIRADTQNPGNNIVILYKAIITQSTGESWDAVPLTLETANPMLGILAPSLSPWDITEAKPKRSTMQHPRSRSRTRSRSPHRHHRHRERDRDLEVDRSRYRSASRSPRRRRHRSPSPIGVPIMQHQAVAVRNNGNSAATFRIPGYVNIPSDAQQHNVTIATVQVRAIFLWRTIPKIDTRVYMTATITNQSAYTLIPGSANIYVDGSFVATTVLPLANPREIFTCALGLDSFLRVKYQRTLENTTVEGLFKRYTNKTYSHQITILNTKTMPIENLHVVDNIPVSQDERIHVNLLIPELSQPSAESVSSLENVFKSGNDHISSPEEASGHGAQPTEKVQVKVYWDSEGDPNIDPNTMGKNGRLNWKVALKPQETVTLTLKYEISHPESLVVEGL
ncbi:hypothetical protein HYPSUDRAFT_38990 [Hypholoma sublateritium FD-334 SS-4]|uniref:DUF4139 domain-containing protein n=1 Tax=Hypholoma sublateritium (strain FD-334 SS-4) TaxID=945553 RepID=A0A0D2MKJ4_HYPSF|nr:hypothetical protein HYPSUDRAFT_38990 [Hypholoma sublateritium FD-334 SS-4]